MSLAATVAGVRLGETGSLLAAVSVLGGFLFALLILVLQMSADAAARTEDDDDGPSPRVLRRVRILREVSANVAYSVLVSIITTTCLAIGDFVLLPVRSPRPGDLVENPKQPAWISAISLFLLVHLALTLLMVLRRTYAIAHRELDFASVRNDRDHVA